MWQIKQKNSIIFIVIQCCLMFPVLVKAQRHSYYAKKYELGILPGVNWFFGDVGGRPGMGKPFVKDWVVSTVRPNVNLFAAYNINSQIAVRLSIAGGSIKATDSNLPPLNSSGRYFRNISVRTDLLESNLGIQYTFRQSAYYDDLTSRFAPYVFVAAGFVYYEPKAIVNSERIRLRPLRTEGQGMAAYPDRKTYSPVALVIPASLGFVYKLNADLFLRAEITARSVFTDYLDDVSTRFIDPVHFSTYLSGSNLNHALMLYDRSGEINNGVNIFNPGNKRGSPENNDSWVSFSIGITYQISRTNKYFRY